MVFQCPATQSHCSVLWMPPGARQLLQPSSLAKASRLCLSVCIPVDRAYRGQAKIKSRLIGNSDPDAWDIPPKPKWMRWGTYNRHVQRFDRYEDVIEEQHFWGAGPPDEPRLANRFRYSPSNRARTRAAFGYGPWLHYMHGALEEVHEAFLKNVTL